MTTADPDPDAHGPSAAGPAVMADPGGPGGPTEGDPPTPGTPGQKPATPPARKGNRWVVELVIVVVVAALLAIVLRTFVVQTFFIPSGSMEPTLQIGDRILVDKLSYHLHSVDRGDIVVFARPPDENCGGPPVNDLVKRVIGLPGERISSSGNTVLINGRPLAEPWLPKGTVLGKAIPPTVVPANTFYVLGDNRDSSCDSRYWGPVPRSLIVGKVVVLVWPLSRFHIF
ncbi:MAG: signal peptidase I [Acidimicrobiales bacterium]